MPEMKDKRLERKARTFAEDWGMDLFGNDTNDLRDLLAKVDRAARREALADLLPVAETVLSEMEEGRPDRPICGVLRRAIADAKAHLKGKRRG